MCAYAVKLYITLHAQCSTYVHAYVSLCGSSLQLILLNMHTENPKHTYIQNNCT